MKELFPSRHSKPQNNPGVGFSNQQAQALLIDKQKESLFCSIPEHILNPE